MFLFGIPYSCNSINTQSRSIPNVCDKINQPTNQPYLPEGTSQRTDPKKVAPLRRFVISEGTNHHYIYQIEAKTLGSKNILVVKNLNWGAHLNRRVKERKTSNLSKIYLFALHIIESVPITLNLIYTVILD